MIPLGGPANARADGQNFVMGLDALDHLGRRTPRRGTPAPPRARQDTTQLALARVLLAEASAYRPAPLELASVQP